VTIFLSRSGSSALVNTTLSECLESLPSGLERSDKKSIHTPDLSKHLEFRHEGVAVNGRRVGTHRKQHGPWYSSPFQRVLDSTTPHSWTPFLQSRELHHFQPLQRTLTIKIDRIIWSSSLPWAMGYVISLGHHLHLDRPEERSQTTSHNHPHQNLRRWELIPNQ